MVMAADLSARLGLIDQATAERISRLVARAGLPIRAPALGVERYLELMRLDKKARAGAMRHVVIESLGRATVRTVEDDLGGSGSGHARRLSPADGAVELVGQ
jgi:3-dehydroquinate synthase